MKECEKKSPSHPPLILLCICPSLSLSFPCVCPSHSLSSPCISSSPSLHQYVPKAFLSISFLCLFCSLSFPLILPLHSPGIRNRCRRKRRAQLNCCFAPICFALAWIGDLKLNQLSCLSSSVGRASCLESVGVGLSPT